MQIPRFITTATLATTTLTATTTRAQSPAPAPAPAAAAAAPDSTLFLRTNLLGYAPHARKTVVACATTAATLLRFEVRSGTGSTPVAPRTVTADSAIGPCKATFRIDLSTITRTGNYHVIAHTIPNTSSARVTLHVTANPYRGAADTLLHYMREQRSGYNPVFHQHVHTSDGIVVDDSALTGAFRPVSGGWADASDYLQYVTTSATATYAMLAAYRDFPGAFADRFRANGEPGANGTPDILDEANHGLAWLLAMFPADNELYNQLGDDRDHTYADLPTTDSSDYGWGKGGPRPIYPCTGRPQGLFTFQNRSTGKASTAGKFASALALGAQLVRHTDSTTANTLTRRARAAYDIGKRSPGVCQTAPARAPYFYEEDDWTDDMELAAAELFALTRHRPYLTDALHFAAEQPVKPWMGADTARHYQWYPWYPAGHFATWRSANRAPRATLASYYRDGLARVAARARNGFRVGIPFIWCSNDLMVAFATQALLYRHMTGDTSFAEYETAAIDWIFGANPWGISMVIGLPASGDYPHDPHSVVSNQRHIELLGGLVDGPVYRSIFQNLKYVQLTHPDRFARLNTGAIVYHDDYGDYSTNEPIMDGTASLIYLVAAVDHDARHDANRPRNTLRRHMH